MGKEDNERFKRVEQQIIGQGLPYSLSHFAGFPFRTFEQIKSASERKEISFGCEYDPDFLEVVGSKADNVINAIWANLPYVLLITNIVLSIVLKKWILLLGIPFNLFGVRASSPHYPLKNSVSGIGGILFVGSFFILDWPWSVIFGLMLFSQIFSMTAREQYRMVVEERALESEVFFCYMFHKGYFLLRDNQNHDIFKPKLICENDQISHDSLF